MLKYLTFASSVITATLAATNPNILVITLDDVGYSDIGGYGAEWETSSIDKFISKSISFTHHYGGYSDSASRSQLMTGIASYHTGYGKMGSSFGTSTLGGIPLGTSTLPEYLKSSNANSDYSTFYIGSWNLGHSLNEHTPNSRGFDYFYGSFNGETDVITKTQAITLDKTDPSVIKTDVNEYIDFWENNNQMSVDDALNDDSNALYAERMSMLINNFKESNNNNNNNKYHSKINKKIDSSGSFLAFLSFQSVSSYDSSSYIFDKEIQNECSSLISKNNNDRHYMCQYMLHLDKQLGKVFESIEDIWENTIVLIVSDNGGALTLGSCNYPFRGGKDSYFEGNTRTVAILGGGLIPESRKGYKLRGLMSNVDWVPTLLAFSNSYNIDKEWTKVHGLDGYNMYSYIMSDNDNNINNVSPPRDHILLDIEMFGTEIYSQETPSQKRIWAWTEDDVSETETLPTTLTGLAMIFYDNNGNLYKYFVSNRNDETSNDDINSEFNWCIKSNNNNNMKYEITQFDVGTLRPFSGLYDLSNDISEQNNLLTKISTDDFNELKEIIKEKADFYIDNDYSELSPFLYDSFDCFYDNYNMLAYPIVRESSWNSFLSNSDEYGSLLMKECGFSSTHPLYMLHTQKAMVDEMVFEDNSDMTLIMNKRQPKSRTNTNNKQRAIATHDRINELFVKEEIPIMKDSDNVYSNCMGLSNGQYYVQIDFDATKPVLTVECSNGYMLINYNNDNNWKEYFSSWIQFHWQVASPFKSDYADMTEWFLPDAKDESTEYDYLISNDCDVCVEDSLYQTEGLSTTYWQSTVPNFCGSADKGVNAADQMWDYQCRNGVFSKGYGHAELIDIWHMTDENGIDRDLLLTQLTATGMDKHLGICSSLKKAKDYENFESQYECATGTGGEMPVLGIKGQFCVCAKEQTSKHVNAKRRSLTSVEKLKFESMESNKAAKEKVEMPNKEKVFYLYSSDFKSGTYRIEESGKYVLMEDIVFDYNAPDYDSNPDYSANQFDDITGNMHWYPKQTQKEEYPGAYEYRDPYHLGFFAGITIEVDDVTIDLNEHSIEMDERYFFQQPFWAHIQIGSNNFIPGKGPSPLGADPKFVNNIVIKNGILGLTSHHCIHGTSPKHSAMTNIVIENLVCKDFTTHGIQLNGFNGLKMENVEVGPTASKHLLTSDYSNMRTLLPRFKYFADLYDSEKFKFGGKPSKEYLDKNNIGYEQVSLNNEDEYTLNEILDLAIEQMDMAFDYVTKRKSEEELYNEFGLEWLQAKRVFVYETQNGVPYGGSLYGVYLNYPGTGITGYYTNNEVSKNVEINNLYIHDLTHGTVETPCLTDHSKSIFGVAVAAQKLLGDANFNDWENIDTIQSNDEMYYYGTIVYDMFFAFYSIVSKDSNNIDALNMGAFEDDTLTWVQTGELQSDQKWSMSCGNDPMFHAVKGMYGLRISGIEGALVNNVKIENMKEISNIGTDICGDFVVFSQQQPYMYGYSGNNVHSVSVLHSDVLFNNININNIESTTGNSTAISIYPRSNVIFEGESNEISNIIAGSSFLDDLYDYDSLLNEFGGTQYPNPMPRSCAVKADNFDTQEALVSVSSLTEIDNTQMLVSCMSGYLDCQQNEVNKINTNSWTDFGDFNNNDASSTTCLYNSNNNINNNINNNYNNNERSFNKVLNSLNPFHYSVTAQIIFGVILITFVLICFVNRNSFNNLNAEMQGYTKI